MSEAAAFLLPPFLVAYADHDMLTLAGQGEAFQEALAAKRVASRKLLMKERSHISILRNVVKEKDPLGEAGSAGKLPDEVGETELMRRYDVARTTLRKVLSRIAREGWIEQGVGHGWRFLGMIDSPEAYDESFLFRQSIEVTGLLSPSFRHEPKRHDEIRAEQQRIVDGGWSTMTAAELFDANSLFHEAVAKWSGNRFIYDSVRRINQLRRLVEYSQTSNRKPRKGQAEEHLAIAHKHRHAKHTARVGLARKFRQFSPCPRVERLHQRIGRQSARLREASREHGGICDVLLLLPERVEHGMDEIRAMIVSQLHRKAKRRYRVGSLRPRRA